MSGIRYVATVNVPGYLPMDDEPAVFDTEAGAWAWLRDERERGEDAAYDAGVPLPADQVTEEGELYSGTWYELRGRARDCSMVPDVAGAVGTVYGPTPGRDGADPHDLGLAYTVDIWQGDEEDGDE